MASRKDTSNSLGLLLAEIKVITPSKKYPVEAGLMLVEAIHHCNLSSTLDDMVFFAFHAVPFSFDPMLFVLELIQTETESVITR